MYLKSIITLFLLSSLSLSAATKEITNEENRDLESMREYALSSTTETNPVETSPIDKKSIGKMQIQLAAFSVKENAKKFMEEEKNNGLKMEIVAVYSKLLNKTFYKVVIACDPVENYFIASISSSFSSK